MSVTKAFYDMGWHGINVEPVKEEYNKLCLDRPRDINLNIGAGAENTFLEFFLAGAGTTCEPEVIRGLRNTDDSNTEIIAVKRLSDVFEECLQGRDKTIHFCKIDVEGFEKSVLAGMDFCKFRPWIIAVEATLPGSSIPCHDKWESLLLDNGYELGFSHKINRFYFDRFLPGERVAKIESGFDAVWTTAIKKYKIKGSAEKISWLSMLRYSVRSVGLKATIRSLLN
jgi:FkbM family methyltransferase